MSQPVPSADPKSLVASRLKQSARRAARRLLRPVIHGLSEKFQALHLRLEAAEHSDRTLRADLDALRRRQDHLADQVHDAVAFGWDYVALTRRLAALEDRVAPLSQPTESHLEKL